MSSDDLSAEEEALRNKLVRDCKPYLRKAIEDGMEPDLFAATMISMTVGHMLSIRTLEQTRDIVCDMTNLTMVSANVLQQMAKEQGGTIEQIYGKRKPDAG